MKPASFVPVIGEISPEAAGGIPELGDVISYWTEGESSAPGWFQETGDRWGPAGFVVRKGDDVQGFVVYGPPERFPRAGRFPLGPFTEDAVLVAFVGGDTRTRRRLLVRMLRDLRQRGVGTVEAVASDLGTAHHIPTAFLLESGWRPVRHASYRLGLYTLARVELGSTVEVGEMARALVGRVKLPKLKGHLPAPGALASSSLRSSRTLRLAPQPPLSARR